MRIVDLEDSRCVGDNDYEKCKVEEKETLAEKLADALGLGTKLSRDTLHRYIYVWSTFGIRRAK